MDYAEVRRIHRLEKNSSQLSEVSSDFFLELKSLLSKERKKYLASLQNGSVSKSNYPNLEEMVREIMSIREKKILNKALIAAQTNEYSLKGVSAKEKELFKGVLKKLKEFKEEVNTLFQSKEKKKTEKKKDLKKLSIQMLSGAPSFIGADMKEYGPFEKGETVELPTKTAKILIERKLGVEE